MDNASGKLTVLFEDPYWVGVFERVSDGRLSVSKDMRKAETQKQFELKQQKKKEKHKGH